MKLGMLLAPLLLAGAAAGCTRAEDSLPIPATSDPQGHDLVEGAVVAAAEKSGGYRLYKVVHTDDYPAPIGWEYHMIAYDPKAPSLEEAARLWKSKRVTIAMPHVYVRFVNFDTRDHRVLTVEPLTDAEKATYAQAKKPGTVLPEAPSVTPMQQP